MILKISLVAAVVVAAVVAQVASDLWRSHDRQLSNAERDTANLVRLLDEQTARTFQAVDLSMRAAADAISRLPDDLPERDRAVHEMLVSFMPQLPFVRSLYIVDRVGVMRYLTSQFPADPLDNRARDYFKDLSAAPRETLYIGKLVLSRVSGRWFISAGLRLNDAAGGFAGVILAAVEPDYFQAFYRSLDVGEEGQVALYLADGSLLIGSPHDDSRSGASFADSPLFQEHLPASSQGVFHAPAIGAEPARIVGYRRLEALPLVVTAALSEREVLRDWRAVVIIYAPLLVVFVFFVGVLMWFFLRELRQREALSAALRENSDRLRLALESSETGTWTWNKANDRLIGDENVHRIFGVAPDAYLGTGEAFLRLVHADDRDNVRHAIESCMADGASHDSVYRIYRGDGAIRWIHSRGEPLRGADGALAGLIGVCHDITAQRQAQDALVQGQRMEIVSRMTGGIAHDFNNLLQVVLGNAEILVECLRDNPALRRWAEMTKVAAERGAELTRQLMAFARRQMLDPSKVEVKSLLSSMADKLRGSLGDRTLAFDLADDLCLAMVDIGQLETAILSLTLNACEAMPQGGRLTIAAANRELSADDCHEDDGLTPGRYVALSFADDGVGMTADVLKRCCEPFFTTKDVGAGSGLGLSMVYGFVKQSDGHMTISSRPGAGTTVTLYLPCADGAPAAAADELPQGPRPSDGRKTVLVVDDEPLVRGYVCRQLSDLGYGVIECADAKTALKALGSAQAIELLFSDIDMPGEIDGVGLAEAAVRMRPGIKVLLTSGNAGGFESEDGDRLAGFDVLAKPYRRAALAAALRRSIEPGSKLDLAP